MIEQHLPVLIVVVPLMAAPLCVFLFHRTLVYLFALATCWATFGMSIFLLAKVLESGPFSYELGNWPVPYGIEYVVDYFSAFVMSFVSGIGAIVLTYAPKSLNDEIDPSRHYLVHPMYLLCLTGMLGICITGDLFNVFVFLEISSLSSYALISLGRSRRAPLAAFQYLVMGTIGATFLLIGIGLLYQLTGTLNMADMAQQLADDHGSRTMLVAFAFVTVGLCIKMAVFPLHTWLPNAYTYAPSVVTSFIAATATKVSVYAFIRIVYDIFTPQFAFDVHGLDLFLTVFSLIGIFVASAAAIYQGNLKRLLAYSSIAQVGYMLLGVSMNNQDGLTGGIVHMFNHAVIKGGLFLVVGCFALRLHSVRLEDLRGAAKTMPLTAFAWVLGGLGLIGVPLTAGFISKWLLLTAALDNGFYLVAGLMLISSLLAVVYVWRVVEILYFSEPAEAVESAREAPWSMLIPTYLLIVGILVFGIWTSYSVGVASQAASALLGGAP